jgi:putative RNA 2'-phosphotransferase
MLTIQIHFPTTRALIFHLFTSSLIFAKTNTKMNPTQLKDISKFLSMVLRHNPQKIGIALDTNGWTDVHTLISKLNRKFPGFNLQTLEKVVAENNKQRFAFSPGRERIRASQGHSVQVELDYPPVEPPEFLYHGTVEKYLETIAKDGLQKMSRHHVHLSRDLETAIQVGNRRGKAIILQVKARDMYAAGHQFYCTPNGVWLTNFVPSEFLVI